MTDKEIMAKKDAVIEHLTNALRISENQRIRAEGINYNIEIDNDRLKRWELIYMKHIERLNEKIKKKRPKFIMIINRRKRKNGM